MFQVNMMTGTQNKGAKMLLTFVVSISQEKNDYNVLNYCCTNKNYK